jgi:penicillin-binding protein 1A
MWLDFMQVALRGMPESRLPAPDGLITVRISPDNGCLARAGDPRAIFEIVPRERIPDCKPEDSDRPFDYDQEAPDEEDLF